MHRLLRRMKILAALCSVLFICTEVSASAVIPYGLQSSIF